MAKRQYVEFAFNDHSSVRLQADWGYEQLGDAIAKVMASDGYLWVPKDDEDGTGAFLNMALCTSVKITVQEDAT